MATPLNPIASAQVRIASGGKCLGQDCLEANAFNDALDRIAWRQMPWTGQDRIALDRTGQDNKEGGHQKLL